MRRFLPVLLSVVTVFAAAAGALSPSAGAVVPSATTASGGQGSFGVRLVDIPADLSEDPRARQYIIDNLTPGTTVRRRIEVSNTTNVPLRAELYPDAADIVHGSFVGAPGATASELTSWTTLSTGNLDVLPGATARATVTIAVPGNAAGGERYAVVWAQVSSGRDGNNVALANRTGIRIYLSVGGDNPPTPRFTVDTVTAERDPDGRAGVLAQIHNTGGRALDLTGTLSLSAVTGSLSAGPYRVELGTSLAPGQSEPVRTLVPDEVTDGPWNATLELRSGMLKETYQAQITFPHGQGLAAAAPAVPARPRPASTRHQLLAGAVAAAVVSGAALVFAAIRRRRSGASCPPQPGSW